MFIRKDSKNLSVPAAFSKHPVLVCDFNDRSLYILVGAEKECAVWMTNIEVIAFNNSNDLRDQQVTHDDVPVIVDKVGFTASANTEIFTSVVYCSVYKVRVQPRHHDGGHLQEGGQQHQHQQITDGVPVQRLVSSDQQGRLQVSGEGRDSELIL